MSAVLTLPPASGAFSKLTPRSIVVHNVYEPKTVTVADATQPGGKFIAAGFGKLLQTEELFDFSSWDVNLTLGLGADSYKLTFPNFDGKYTSTFRSGEEIAIYVGYPADPNNFDIKDLSLLIIGRIDDVDTDFDKDEGELIVIEGRNYVAPFVDNKVSKKYQNRTATQIINELVSIYGFGVKTQLNISSTKVFNRTYLGRSKTGLAQLAAQNSQANVQFSDSNAIAGLAQGVTQTPSIIDNVIGVNNTVWDIFERLADALADEKTGKEFKVYVGGDDGKTLYFGPRQDSVDANGNALPPLVTLTYGINTTKIKVKETRQFLKTRIIMRQYDETKKKTYDIIIPDDLGPETISAQEKQQYLNLRKRYGTLDDIIKDKGKFILGDVAKAKRIGLARLRESARLTYSGSATFPGVEYIKKEGMCSVQGIPDVNGIALPQFPYKVSPDFNATYYIEGARHEYAKSNGYLTSLELTTRRKQRKKSTLQTATDVERAGSQDIEATE